MRLLALALALLPAPAFACLPPPPGSVEPPPRTEAERAEGIFRHSTNIVYGVVTREPRDNGAYRFKILHVYKGGLTPGRTINVAQSWGFDPPPCMMSSPPPMPRGEYGVIAFNEEAELNFVSDARLTIMFDKGWIQRASPKRP